jgi:hypothetical protein
VAEEKALTKALTKVDDIDHKVSTSKPFKYYHMNGLSPMD